MKTSTTHKRLLGDYNMVNVSRVLDMAIKLNDINWGDFVDLHNMMIQDNPNSEVAESSKFGNFYLYIGTACSAYVYTIADDTIHVLFETKFKYAASSFGKQHSVRRLNMGINYKLTREEMIDLYYTSMAYSI